MDLWLAAKSLLVGLAVAAPVGPMSLLCIHRTLARGLSAGLVFGTGIAAADGTYAALAAFGVSAVSSALLGASNWIRLAGSLAMICLGLHVAKSRPATTAAQTGEASGLRAFALAYGLTIANPPTILFFASVFASMAPLSSLAQSLVFTLGVLAGSLLWWVALSALVTRAAARLTPQAMRWINRASGLVLVAFGCYGLALTWIEYAALRA